MTRLCLDRIKSARAQRETYVGPWLPEPVFDAEGLAPDAATELADDLSFALLLALDRIPGWLGIEHELLALPVQCGKEVKSNV